MEMHRGMLNTVPECNLYCKRVYILVWFTWFTIFYGWANWCVSLQRPRSGSCWRCYLWRKDQSFGGYQGQIYHSQSSGLLAFFQLLSTALGKSRRSSWAFAVLQALLVCCKQPILMTHEHSLACVPLVPPTFSYLFCGALNNHKAQLHPKELKIYVETLAFKHLGIEIVERRVDAVITAFMDRPVKMGWETQKNHTAGTSVIWGSRWEVGIHPNPRNCIDANGDGKTPVKQFGFDKKVKV